MSTKQETKKLYARAYYEKNAEAIRAKSREWSKANPDHKKATRKKYYSENREKIIAKSKAWLADNPERKRAWNRERRFRKVYGITLAQFDEMMEMQGGACAICAEPLVPGPETHVDHCHSTGSVRAILCGSCNRGVGVIEKHGGTWVARAQIYLARHALGSVLELGLWRAEFGNNKSTAVSSG